MVLGAGAGGFDTNWAASLISNRPRSEPPWMDSSTPCAPSMLASSSGLEIAISAAATDRSSPRAEPMPMSAEPAPDMTDLTSAKSRVIRPGVVISGLGADVGVRPRPQATGEFPADVELDVGIAHQERLGICVDRDELNA